MSAPDVAALLARHPMPWRVKLAYAIDANGNTVLDDHGYAPDPRQLFDALATALRAALADQRRECEWRYMYWPESESAFDTGCGKSWEFADGGIAENGVVFCHHCGGKVIAPEIPNSCIDCGDEISATATRCNDCDAALTADGGGDATIGGARIVADETIPLNTAYVIVDGKHVGTITDLDGGGV